MGAAHLGAYFAPYFSAPCFLIALSGCDLGPSQAEARAGPELRLLASHPADGAGIECGADAPSDCGVPLDASIELRFDRYLLPATVVRQSIEVSSGSIGAFLQPSYDAIEQVVVFTLAGGGTWKPGTRYTVEIRRPSDNADGWGFRAFDGVELGEDGPAPLRFMFRTAREPPAPVEPKPQVGWAEMRDVVERGGCASGNCHGPPALRMGLDLSDGAGFEATALGEVAHQTEGETNAGEALQSPARFGVDMSLVARAQPSGSYLFYKLLIDPDSYRGDCASRHAVALSGCVAFPRDEVTRVREWFVRGQGMPLEDQDGQHLTLSELHAVQSWIAAGAPAE